MAAYKGCLEQSLLQQDNTNNKQLTGKQGNHVHLQALNKLALTSFCLCNV